MEFVYGIVFITLGYFVSDYAIAYLRAWAGKKPSIVTCFYFAPKFRFSIEQIRSIMTGVIMAGFFFGGILFGALTRSGLSSVWSGLAGGLVTRLIIGLANSKIHREYIRARNGSSDDE